jgi:RimJ/RimL family protein N-acetyltransferase
VLRPLDWTDAEAHLAGEDPALVRWFNGGHGTRENVEDFLRQCMDQWLKGGPVLTFGIRAGDDLVGTIELGVDLPGSAAGEAEVSYGLYPRGRGHGYATRAVLLGCDFLRGRRELDHAVIQVDPRNAASVAVAVRSGFTWSYRRPGYTGGFDCYRRDLRPG